MPYLPQERRIFLRDNPQLANTEGDLNYLFTLKYLDEFIKEPRYHTLARLKTPLLFKPIQELYSLYTKRGSGFTLNQVVMAMEVAYIEFYRRIGSLYEEYAMEKNGDLDEYLQAEQLIHKLASNGTQASSQR